MCSLPLLHEGWHQCGDKRWHAWARKGSLIQETCNDNAEYDANLRLREVGDRFFSGLARNAVDAKRS